MAKLVNCPTCNLQVSNKANSCPHCGMSFLKGSHAGIIFLYFIIAIIIVFAFLAFEAFR